MPGVICYFINKVGFINGGPPYQPGELVHHEFADNF